MLQRRLAAYILMFHRVDIKGTGLPTHAEFHEGVYNLVLAVHVSMQ